MNNDLQCPYCDAPNEVCHDDGQNYAEGNTHEMQCSSCHKNFVFSTSIRYAYYPEKAECLNGSPHDFYEWRHMWTNAQGGDVQRRGCMACDHVEQRTVPKS